VLGAAVGVPLLARHCEERSDEAIQALESAQGGLLPPAQVRGRNDGDEWASALAAFRGAQTAVAAIESATAGRSVEDEEAWLPAHAAACDAAEAALARAIAAPAPDLGALAGKLELVFAHALEPGAVEAGVVEAVMADSRRLLLRRG
jgi:hypothetical protein